MLNVCSPDPGPAMVCGPEGGRVTLMSQCPVGRKQAAWAGERRGDFLTVLPLHPPSWCPRASANACCRQSSLQWEALGKETLARGGAEGQCRESGTVYPHPPQGHRPFMSGALQTHPPQRGPWPLAPRIPPAALTLCRLQGGDRNRGPCWARCHAGGRGQVLTFTVRVPVQKTCKRADNR